MKDQIVKSNSRLSKLQVRANSPVLSEKTVVVTPHGIIDITDYANTVQSDRNLTANEQAELEQYEAVVKENGDRVTAKLVQSVVNEKNKRQK